MDGPAIVLRDHELARRTREQGRLNNYPCSHCGYQTVTIRYQRYRCTHCNLEGRVFIRLAFDYPRM